MISIVAKLRKSIPEKILSHLSLQNLSTTTPKIKATKMHKIWAAAPPIMIPRVPYFAASPIAAT